MRLRMTPYAGSLKMLRDSGIELVEAPDLDRKKPATSLKQTGRSRFHVDLLVPSRHDTFPTVPIPELKAHATGLPYLGYLLAESQTAMLAAREGCCAVRVPLPERFAIHKLIVSQLRVGRDAKSRKDLDQAAVLCAALAELHPGALEGALAEVPARAKKYLKTAFRIMGPRLGSHPRAVAELGI